MIGGYFQFIVSKKTGISLRQGGVVKSDSAIRAQQEKLGCGATSFG